MHLWNRENEAHPDFGTDFKHARSTAFWYYNLYMNSIPRPIEESREIIIGLASVFLAFKAADYIPGTGRVRMSQLIEAYVRTTGCDLIEPHTSRVIDQICRTEMDIMCLSGFNFRPC